MGIHKKNILGDYNFILKDRDGNDMQCTGAYLITYGGYHLWRCCQAPIKCAWNEDECEYSARLESVRKNVEATFGILKVRFRIPKSPMMYHSSEKVDNTFKACCILHNILLEYDGLNSCWNDPVNWSMRGDDDADIAYGLQRAP